MTHAQIKTQEGLCWLKIEGHAEDKLLCAGISTLVCGVLNALGRRAWGVIYEPGSVRLCVRLDGGYVDGVIEVARAALRAMAEERPENVILQEIHAGEGVAGE